MIESLLCNSCGAPLEVPDSANFIKCNHCDTQLAIRRDNSVTFTETIDRLAKSTEALHEEVKQLSAQQAIADLDRQWQIERENFYVKGENGSRHLPSEGGAVVGGVIAAVFGVFWTFMTISMGAPGFFPLFGILFIGMGIFGAIHTSQKAGDYKAAESRYRRERSRLQNGKPNVF
jgi:LSD1 subclass zinc finger protein